MKNIFQKSPLDLQTVNESAGQLKCYTFTQGTPIFISLMI